MAKPGRDKRQVPFWDGDFGWRTPHQPCQTSLRLHIISYSSLDILFHVLSESRENFYFAPKTKEKTLESFSRLKFLG
jgi:hypothetical protein